MSRLPVSELMKEEKRFAAASLGEPIASTTPAARSHVASIEADLDSRFFLSAPHH